MNKLCYDYLLNKIMVYVMKYWTIKNYDKFINSINKEFNFIKKEQKELINYLDYDDNSIDYQKIIDEYIIFYVSRYGVYTDYGTTSIDQGFLEIKKEQLLIYNYKVVGIVFDQNDYVIYPLSLDNIDFSNVSDQSDDENYICYYIKRK